MFSQKNGPIFRSPKHQVTKVLCSLGFYEYILNTSKKPDFEFRSGQLDLNRLVALQFFPIVPGV